MTGETSGVACEPEPLVPADDCEWTRSDLRPACPRSERRAKRNEHLSVSRMKLYISCHAAYGFRYVAKAEAGPRESFSVFGNLLHETLEELFRWVRHEEFKGDLPLDKTIEIYRATWAKYGLAGLDMYQEGINMLRAYVAKHPPVDHFNILGIEEEFNIEVGEFIVNGFIDRCDKVDDETVRIIDYKSNRILFTRDEVDTDLQMSVYGLVAKRKWPWAKKFEFVFHMLRHEVPIYTERTDQDLSDCYDYVIATGRKMETDDELRPRLNENCCYCEYRWRCDAYQSAVAGKVEKLAYTKEDLVSVALAHEQAHKLAKIMYARKKELQDILKAKLEEQEELELPEAGAKYRLITYTQDTTYPIDKTLSLMSKYTGRPREELEPELLQISQPKVRRMLEVISETNKSKATILQAELDNVATRTLGSRFDSQPLKQNSKRMSRKDGSSAPKQVGPLDIDELTKALP